jgi:hypothetical protein
MGCRRPGRIGNTLRDRMHPDAQGTATVPVRRQWPTQVPVKPNAQRLPDLEVVGPPGPPGGRWHGPRLERDRGPSCLGSGRVVRVPGEGCGLRSDPFVHGQGLEDRL